MKKITELFEELAVVFQTPLQYRGEKVMYLTNTEHKIRGMDFGVIITPNDRPLQPFLVPWGKVDHVELAPVKKIEPKVPTARGRKPRRK